MKPLIGAAPLLQEGIMHNLLFPTSSGKQIKLIHTFYDRAPIGKQRAICRV